jgi:hypothetical protein
MCYCVALGGLAGASGLTRSIGKQAKREVPLPGKRHVASAVYDGGTTRTYSSRERTSVFVGEEMST